eukprot:7027811-Pyramimonas_sp.AAC.1
MGLLDSRSQSEVLWHDYRARLRHAIVARLFREILRTCSDWGWSAHRVLAHHAGFRCIRCVGFVIRGTVGRSPG